MILGNIHLVHFYIDDNKAKLIHIGPKFERVEEGVKIISYVDKFEY